MTIAQDDTAHGFHLLKDGDAWCAVGPEYVDLQRSPAGFGDTPGEAVKGAVCRTAQRRLARQRAAGAERVQGPRMTLTLPREEIRPRGGPLSWPTGANIRLPVRIALRAAALSLRSVLPAMPENQAKVETNYTIAYTAANHTAWFWKGV